MRLDSLELGLLEQEACQVAKHRQYREYLGLNTFFGRLLSYYATEVHFEPFEAVFALKLYVGWC